MIDIKFILKEEDFLQANLYFFKKEGKLKQIILRTWLAYLFIISIIIGFLVWKEEMLMALVLVCILAIITFFHSGRMRRHYFHYYKKKVKVYESRFFKEVKLKVTDNQLHNESVAGQSNVFLAQISSIDETQNYFFIKLKFEGIIIPKSELKNVSDLRNDLIELAQKVKVQYQEDLNWKW